MTVSLIPFVRNQGVFHSHKTLCRAIGSKRKVKVFQGSFKGVLRKFQGCFKEISRVFHGSFKVVSRKFQGCLKEVSRGFHGRFKGVVRAFQGCF